MVAKPLSACPDTEYRQSGGTLKLRAGSPAAYAANLSPTGKPCEARRPPSASTTMAW